MTPATKLISVYLVALLSIIFSELKIISGKINNGAIDSMVANPDLVFAEKNKPVTSIRISDRIKMKRWLSLNTLATPSLLNDKILSNPKSTRSLPCQLGKRRGRQKALTRSDIMNILCVIDFNINKFNYQKPLQNVGKLTI